MKDSKIPSTVRAAAPAGIAEPADAWGLLTDAEWRLVLFAASGRNDREVAKATGKTQTKVKEQFQALLDKLGLADRLTLVLASFADAPRLRSYVLRRRLRSSNNGEKIHAERSS